MTKFDLAFAWIEQHLGEEPANDFKVWVNTEDQRVGQAFMNVLRHHKPEYYEELTATDADPFYVDDKLVAAFNMLHAYNVRGPA